MIKFADKSINKHYYYAAVIPLVLYFILSLFGYAIYDHGAILIASMNVANGVAPYRDFHWVITPFTLYTQAALQHLFWFIPPIFISIVWKGITSLILSFSALIFLSKMNIEIGIKEPLPTPLIYLLSLTFYFIGPINETHVGYTTDAIFFAVMGVLLILWPKPGITDFIKNETIHFIGYFILGLSFCYKQEIGMISIFGGVAFIITRYLFIFKKLESRNAMNLLFIPIFTVLIPTSLLFMYFYLTGQLNEFIQSVFVIPSKIKKTGFATLISLLTLGLGSDFKNLILSILNGEYPFNNSNHFINIKSWILILLNLINRPVFIATFSFLLAWLINFSKSENYKFFSDVRTKIIFFRLIIIIFLLLGIFQLMSENYWIVGLFPQTTTISKLSDRINYLSTMVFDFTYLLLLWTSLFLFIISCVRLNLIKRFSIPFFRYFFGVCLLFIVFDGAALAGLGDVRSSRIVIPLFLLTIMVLIVYFGNFRSNKKIAYLNIYWLLGTITFFFLCARFGNSKFSPVMSDPLHRQISYSPRLKCYVDSQVLNSMENMNRIINRTKYNNVFVYQSESMLYYYFQKMPQTFSIIHYSDFYPHLLDSVEIKKMANVKFVVKSSKIEKGNTFSHRENDPIMTCIENNYRIAYSDNYYTLLENKVILK